MHHSPLDCLKLTFAKVPNDGPMISKKMAKVPFFSCTKCLKNMNMTVKSFCKICALALCPVNRFKNGHDLRVIPLSF